MLYGCLTVFWGVARKNLAKIVISIVFFIDGTGESTLEWLFTRTSDEFIENFS